ncbi:4'-phosphopantetheinyl transferase family protein [Streptomyces tanashiensis]
MRLATGPAPPDTDPSTAARPTSRCAGCWGHGSVGTRQRCVSSASRAPAAGSRTADRRCRVRGRTSRCPTPGTSSSWAFGDAPVGVDVEPWPSPGTAADVAEAFHRAERAEPAALPARERPAAVARCWARKEAHLKGVGIGLGEDPARTYVGTGTTPAAPPGWAVTDVPALPGYAAARAVRTADLARPVR